MRDDLRSRFRSTLADLGHETPDMARSRADADELLVKALLREVGRRSDSERKAVDAVCTDRRARAYVRAYGRAGVEALAKIEVPAVASGRKAWSRLADTLRKAVERRG